MIPYLLTFGILLAVIVAAVYAVGRLAYFKICGKKLVIKSEIVPLLFVMYIAGILALTFYRPPLWNGADVNLIPFKTILGYLSLSLSLSASSGEAQLNLIGNVVFFAPFGIFIPTLFLKLRRFSMILMTAIAIPLIIEVAQFIFGRSADVDDIILNAIGILAGYAVYKIFTRNKPQKQN